MTTLQPASVNGDVKATIRVILVQITKSRYSQAHILERDYESNFNWYTEGTVFTLFIPITFKQ
jgi:hypothetical protein